MGHIPPYVLTGPAERETTLTLSFGFRYAILRQHAAHARLVMPHAVRAMQRMARGPIHPRRPCTTRKTRSDVASCVDVHWRTAGAGCRLSVCDDPAWWPAAAPRNWKRVCSAPADCILAVSNGDLTWRKRRLLCCECVMWLPGVAGPELWCAALRDPVAVASLSLVLVSPANALHTRCRPDGVHCTLQRMSRCLMSAFQTVRRDDQCSHREDWRFACLCGALQTTSLPSP